MKANQKMLQTNSGAGQATGAVKPMQPEELIEKELDVIRDKNGNIIRVVSNAQNFLRIFRNDPLLKGAICHNELSDATEIIREMEWRRETSNFTDVDESNVRAYIEKNYLGLHSRTYVDDAIRIVANENSYNPIIDMVESIEWDGQERILNLFPRYLGTERTLLNDEAVMLIFMGGLERLFNPGSKFEYMPCIVGGQGCGKSTLIRMLAMKDEYFCDDIRNISDDKVFEKIRGHWIIEMAEMIATANAKTVEEIKAFISRQKENYRFPYDKYSCDRLRRCIFIGTTNNADFLPLDRTGNRRFIPIQAGVRENIIHPLENEAECRAYIKQCWAEALVKYKSGDYTLDLSKEAKELLKVVQEDYTPEDSRVGLIKKYLDGGNFEYVCAKQIWSEALHMDTEMKTYDSKDIGSIMNNQIEGWERVGSHKFEEFGVQRAWKRKITSEFVEVADEDLKSVPFE